MAKNIAQQNIELSDGIQIKDLTKVENPNYVFITINTNEINTPKFKIFLKNGKKTISTYQYELKEERLIHLRVNLILLKMFST